eukprot:s2709_g1.t1
MGPVLIVRWFAKGPGNEEWQADCDSGGSKKSMIQALLKVQLGPDVPEKGVRMCHPGIAMGYDVALRNPAWCAYRLTPSEQSSTDNERMLGEKEKGFVLDPALRAAGIEQTNPSQYENTGFDKGHLAPSLATSFDRKELGWQELENALHEYAVDLPREFWLLR